MSDIKPNMKVGDLVERLHLKKNGRYFGFGTSPKADWKITFFTALVSTFLLVAMCCIVFVLERRGELFQAEVEVKSEVKPLNTKLLEETVSYYLGKQALFETATKTKLQIADPSL